jgi:hypothetical protein
MNIEDGQRTPSHYFDKSSTFSGSTNRMMGTYVVASPPAREQIYSPEKKRMCQWEEEGCLEHASSDLCYPGAVVESMISQSCNDKKCILAG